MCHTAHKLSRVTTEVGNSIKKKLCLNHLLITINSQQMLRCSFCVVEATDICVQQKNAETSARCEIELNR